MFCDSDIPEKFSFLIGYDKIYKYEILILILFISVDQHHRQIGKI
jgi:hypothetical protein